MRSDRKVGYLAAAVVATLIGAAVVYGLSTGRGATVLADIGAWLPNSNGTASHVNGLTGTVDGTVTLDGASGHQLEVTQSGNVIVIIDRTTGLVSRIDPAQLTVGRSQDYGHNDLSFIAGDKVAYIEAPGVGLIQQVDPMTLALVGKPLSLPAPLGRAAVDKLDVLWVPVPQQGVAVPVTAGVAGTPVRVGQPGESLVLTIAGGTPVVTNAGGRLVTVIESGGRQLSVNLPLPASSLLTPESTDGATVPLLAPESGTLSLVNTATGALTAVDVPGREKLGAPHTLGHRVYIPDAANGTLVVFNTESGRFEDRITVTGVPGELRVIVRDGLLWANDQNSTKAVVIGPDGQVRHIAKHEEPTRTPGPARTSDKPIPTSAATSPAPPPTPQAPGTVTATSGAGFITVGFAPAASAEPVSYTLSGAPPGATVSPVQVPPRGQPFQFVVTGGACDQTYAFTVVANYPSGGLSSPPSSPVRPCVPPGPPSNLRGQAVEHGADLSWTAPAQTGGGTVHYKVFHSGRDTGFFPGATQTITGLTNFQSYRFDLEAANPSGTSSRINTSVTLTGPTFRATVYPTSIGQADVRDGPFLSSAILGAPAGNSTVTVICQVRGDRVSTGSDIWDRIQWSGPTGYISDLYLNTPNSAQHTFSNPALWSCS